MSYIFKIDDTTFPTVGLLSCTRNVEIREGQNAGYSTITGTRIRDVIGLFVGYDIVIDLKQYNQATRDSLLTKLESTRDFHTFVLPTGNTTATITGYIDGYTDELQRMIDGTAEWGQISLTIYPRSGVMNS